MRVVELGSRRWRVVALAGALAGVGLAAVGAAVARAGTPPALPAATWQRTFAEPSHLSSPTVASIEGVSAVVVADMAGMLHVLNGATGAELPGWPRPVQVVPGQTVAVEATPTVAVLDGATRIIVGAGSLNVPNQNGGIEVFNTNGSVDFRFQTAGQQLNEWTGDSTGPSGFSQSVVDAVAVGNLGNGQNDLVFGSFDHFIYALDGSGHLLPGFPYQSWDTVWDTPALYDGGGIGHDDIYIGSDATPNPTNPHGPCFGLPSGGYGVMRDLRVTPTGPYVVWARCVHQIAQSSPAIGMLDGQPDVVYGTGDNPAGGQPATDEIMAVNARDGSPVPGFPVDVNNPVVGSPAIGDINGQGNSVVVTTCALAYDDATGADPGCSNPPGLVWAVSATGHKLWSQNPGADVYPDSHGWAGEVISSPILADMSGDGVNDVIVPMGGQTAVLNGYNGAFAYQPVNFGRVANNAAAVADFGGTTGWRLVTQTFTGLPTQGTTFVDSYPLPVAPKVAPAWPQFHLDAAHNGADLAPARPATAGYWLASSDGGIFSYGNAAFHGSAGAHPLNRPVVGMARTPDGLGYWLVASDGGIFAFGDAAYYGSMGGQHLNAPIVGMAATPDGLGYWLVASDGGMFTFGDAPFYGSQAYHHLNAPIVAMAHSGDGKGYDLVASDGGIFAFGDTQFQGSEGGQKLNRPIVGMTMTADNGGYWLVASDGGIFSFGDARFEGSTGGQRLNAPAVAVADSFY